MKRRDFIMGVLAMLPFAACGGNRPAYAARPSTEFVFIHRRNAYDQLLFVEQWIRDEHRRLLEEGFIWDGQDGYSKQIDWKELK